MSGAVCGAFIAGLVAPTLLFIVFGIVLFISVIPLVFKLGEELPQNVKSDRLATALSLSSTYPDTRLGVVSYQATNTHWGFGIGA